MTSISDELLPCPFCGATPHRGPTKYEADQLRGEPFQNYAIWCPHSCSRINRANKEQAIAAWNRRPSHEGVVVWPDWATDKHIAEGILAEAETILQLVIHGKEGEIALHTGAIKSYAGTLLGREQRRAQYTVPALSPNKEDEDATA